MKKLLPLLIILFGSLVNTQAQIIYTDVIDTTISRSTLLPGTVSYNFNLNGDSVNDFTFSVRSQTVTATNCPIITPTMKTNVSAFVAPAPPFVNYVGDTLSTAAKVSYGSMIDSASHSWDNAVNNVLYKVTQTFPNCVWDSLNEGNWRPGDSGYVALKFKVGANILFGWVHCLITTSSPAPGDDQISITIFDYAYNSVSNTPIAAGDTGFITGINAVSVEEVSIYPNPSSGKFNFNTDRAKQLQVFNLQGEIILSREMNDGVNEIDLSEFESGYYLYKIICDDKISMGKLMKQ